VMVITAATLPVVRPPDSNHRAVATGNTGFQVRSLAIS
jgi:hypothetical protein